MRILNESLQWTAPHQLWFILCPLVNRVVTVLIIFSVGRH